LFGNSRPITGLPHQNPDYPYTTFKHLLASTMIFYLKKATLCPHICLAKCIENVTKNSPCYQFLGAWA